MLQTVWPNDGQDGRRIEHVLASVDLIVNSRSGAWLQLQEMEGQAEKLLVVVTALPARVA